jgi:aryl-alcohol dehydrogenase-like predicted oxidoreductase
MNVLVDAPRMQETVRTNNMTTLIRSPLAMGVLTGKYGADESVPADDIRATTRQPGYFRDGRANPDHLASLNLVRDLLTVDGRSLAQGAICWLWAKGAANVPVPGARTVEQIEGLTEALAFGALSEDVMAQIEAAIERDPCETPDRER